MVNQKFDKDYWIWYGVSNYSKVKGTLHEDGGFTSEGHSLSEKSPHIVGKNIFLTEIDCIDEILRKKKDAVEVLRLEIDELEVKKGKLLWPASTPNLTKIQKELSPD